jgi:hypothetical protein
LEGVDPFVVAGVVLLVAEEELLTPEEPDVTLVVLVGVLVVVVVLGAGARVLFAGTSVPAGCTCVRVSVLDCLSLLLPGWLTLVAPLLVLIVLLF